MLDEERVRELLERRFIEPTRAVRPLYVGVELEFPLVNLAKRPVDFVVVHRLTERFREHFSARRAQALPARGARSCPWGRRPEL